MRVKNKSWDAVVIGAGVAGLGVAAGLVELGKKVLVLSKKEHGESSPAAGGILDPFLEMSPGHPLFELSRKAFNAYPAFVRNLEKVSGFKIGYRKTGMLFIAMNDEQVQELDHRFRWQKKTGLPVQWVIREAALRKYPMIAKGMRAGLFYPTVARVHPKKLVAALEAYAVKRGALVVQVTQSPVLIKQKGRVLGVQASGCFFESQAVVNATGAWASAGDVSGVLPVAPAKGEIMVVRGKEHVPTILHSLDGGYIVPWSDKASQKGSYDYLLGSTVRMEGFSAQPSAAGLKEVLKKNARIMPTLTKYKKVDEWAGLRPYSKKKLPLLGASGKVKGLYFAAGYYRSGVLIGSYAGRLLARLIASGRTSPEIAPFNPGNFNL